MAASAFLAAFSAWLLLGRESSPAVAVSPTESIAKADSAIESPPAAPTTPPADEKESTNEIGEQPADRAAQPLQPDAQPSIPDVPDELAPADKPANQGWKIDFVRKDILTVMHYIGLRTNLDLIVERDLDVEVTVLESSPAGESKEKAHARAIRLLERICEYNNLEMIQDRTSILIKRKPGFIPEIAPGSFDGRWNANFKEVSAIYAANKAATTMNVALTAPSIKAGDNIPLITIYMREAEPEMILRAIAAEAGMDLLESSNGGAPKFELRLR